jgi:serine phosphatase RsbU (regulator of sigma subunit)/ligand-binding sensor domain-containing protein
LLKIIIISVLFVYDVVFPAGFKQLHIDNLSSSRVLSASQDSSGFIWIGTDEGLNRFDGFSNKVYRSNVFDENTISGNRLWITHIDKNNTLWVGTDRGVCYYDEKTDVFNRIETGSRPIHLIEGDEYICFTTKNSGVLKLSKKTKKITSLQFDPLDPFSLSSSKFSENQSSPACFYEDVLWVGTTNGLNKTNIKTGHTKRLYSGKSNLVKSDTITALLVSNDVLYVGTTNGLGVSDLAFGSTIEGDWGALKDSHILNVFKISETDMVGVVIDKEISLLNKGGVTQRIKTENSLENVTNLETGQYLLSSKNHKKAILLTIADEITHRKTETPIRAREIFVDKEEGVWAVGDGGIARAGNTKSPVRRVLDVLPKEGKFSRSGTDLFFLEGNKVLSYGKNQTKQHTTTNTLNEKPNTKLYVSKNKGVYFYDRALEKTNPGGKTDQLTTFDTPINLITSQEDRVFISLKNSGIAEYDAKTGDVTDHRLNKFLSRSLPTGASTFLLDKNTLWVGSDESGLYEVDISEKNHPKVIQHHTYSKTNPLSFSSGSVSCLTKHSDILFVGTNGDGLFLYRGDSFTRFASAEGMPSNNIVSLSASSDTTIWVLTNGGLVLVDWKNKNTNIVSKEEGLDGFFKDENSLIPRGDGGVYVVSPQGLQSVSVDQLYTNEYEASVVIESVQLFDKNNKKHMADKNNIRVTHTTPTIKINLTAPSIFKADKTTFSYLIEGYHSTWVDNGARRYVELQGLKPGSYTVKIKSQNSDGYESKNTAVVNFQIIPPWWKTWWAYLLYTASTLALFAYYVSFQKRAQAKATEDQRKEEELEQARQFQLDMLPRETPDELGLDISATIETASEVGGDYYDYFPQKDKKSLYVVVGDATGHGMTAGMMVSITKAGLYGIPESTPPNDVARQLNRVIKNIDLGWNRMAFNMARFWDDRVEFTSAAMPPVYHYHNTTGELDEVLLGGLPLGSIKDENFVLEEFGFNYGDSLVFISDGLPEAENKEGEMLGYDAVYSCIKANGGLSAEEQKQALLDLGSAWLGELQNQDDITIVVVKKSNPLE